MRLRIAKKIVAAVGEPRETSYNGGQVHRAMQRVSRTKSERASAVYWNHMLGNELTIADRAYILGGAPEKALDLLMRHDEKDWNKTARQIADGK